MLTNKKKSTEEIVIDGRALRRVKKKNIVRAMDGSLFKLFVFKKKMLTNTETCFRKSCFRKMSNFSKKCQKKFMFSENVELFEKMSKNVFMFSKLFKKCFFFLFVFLLK